MLCSIPGCGGESRAKGFCWKHYMRLRRTGDPTKTLKPGRPRLGGGQGGSPEDPGRPPLPLIEAAT